MRSDGALAVRRPAPVPPVLVPPERIQDYLGNLVGVLETDPARGGKRLGRHLAQVTMTPEGEGPERRYRASEAFNLSTLLREASGKSSSGGPGLELPDEWVSFERAVPRT